MYQHHGRLASNGRTWAAYFSVAITVRNGDCVDIHEGDRMQVVGADGSIVDRHRDGFPVGCSHSRTPRIAWDPRAGRYVTVCATDNACRIARPAPYRTVASGTCDGTLFGGDLVLAEGSGYWTAWSQGGRVRLEHFTTGPSDTTIRTAARSSHPHLVSYGAGRMLLAWGSGSAMAAQAYDAGTGRTVGDQFTVRVPEQLPGVQGVPGRRRRLSGGRRRQPVDPDRPRDAVAGLKVRCPSGWRPSTMDSSAPSR